MLLPSFGYKDLGVLCTSRQYSRSRGGRRRRRRRRGRSWSWWWCWDGYHCRRWCLCLSSTLRLADKRSASTHSTLLTLCLPPPALTVQTPVSGKLLHLSVQCCHHEAIPSCLLHAAGQMHSVEYLRLPSCRLLSIGIAGRKALRLDSHRIQSRWHDVTAMCLAASAETAVKPCFLLHMPVSYVSGCDHAMTAFCTRVYLFVGLTRGR